MNEIKIFGTTGVGKSVVADLIQSNPNFKDQKVMVSDHELFTSNRSFNEALNRVKGSHADSKADVSIIVINDGSANLKIEFTNRANYSTLNKIFAMSYQKNENNLQ